MERHEIEPLNPIIYKSIPGANWECNGANLLGGKKEYLDDLGVRRSSIDEKPKGINHKEK